LTIGEAPSSGINNTVDKKSSSPLRRFSKNAGLNLAIQKISVLVDQEIYRQPIWVAEQVSALGVGGKPRKGFDED